MTAGLIKRLIHISGKKYGRLYSLKNLPKSYVKEAVKTLDTAINKDIKTPLGSNIQNSGQNFNQGPTGFKDNHIEPQTNPANPFNTPQTMTEPTLPE